MEIWLSVTDTYNTMKLLQYLTEIISRQLRHLNTGWQFVRPINMTDNTVNPISSIGSWEKLNVKWGEKREKY